MADDIVIRAEGLGKKYTIGHAAERERYTALRDVLTRGAKGLWRRTVDVARGRAAIPGDTVEEFWALKDVSFEVKRGEVLGIIGRNGAGKSTLLKILSRITEPSEGRVAIKGSVASLLEVGTGFHPELTGRENIYLNGAILGMTRAEIRKKFDEIVAFAEVEKFLDTPVKRYSSGMYVRLAFAVAAHLEPEILVVDEVLAVGDVEFQEKCIGKMGEVSRRGQTVLLVTHDMRRIAALAGHGLLLKAGKVDCAGPMTIVRDRYLMRSDDEVGSVCLSARDDRSGSGEARFQSLELLSGGEHRRAFEFGEPFTEMIRITVRERIGPITVHSNIASPDGVIVHEFYNDMQEELWSPDAGEYILTIDAPKISLYPGRYSVDIWMGDKTGSRVDYIKDATIFEMSSHMAYGMRHPLERANGLVHLPARWECRRTKPVGAEEAACHAGSRRTGKGS